MAYPLPRSGKPAEDGKIHFKLQKTNDINRKDKLYPFGCSKEAAENLLLSAGVKTGIVPVRDACERIFSDYEKRNTADYSGPGIDANLDTPSKYLCFAAEQKMDLNSMDIDRFNHIARSMLNYLYRLPKRDINFARCVSLFQNLIIYYQEKPGCMTMADLCLSSFAALHPPTYVHVNIVAKLTESMTRHLLRTRPELFLRFPGAGSLEAVREKEEEIVSAWKRARADVQGNIPPAEKNAVK